MAKAILVVGVVSREASATDNARIIFVTNNAEGGGSTTEMQGLLVRFGERKFKYGQVAPIFLGSCFKDRLRVQVPKKGEVYV
jgi:hypothetical protein